MRHVGDCSIRHLMRAEWRGISSGAEDKWISACSVKIVGWVGGVIQTPTGLVVGVFFGDQFEFFFEFHALAFVVEEVWRLLNARMGSLLFW